MFCAKFPAPGIIGATKTSRFLHLLARKDSATTGSVSPQEDTMRHLRLHAQSGPCLLVICAILGNTAVLAQSTTRGESDSCTLVENCGDICLGTTSASVAKQVCSKVYVKDCTDAGMNNGTCKRDYKKEENNKVVTRCAFDVIKMLNQIPARDRCGQRAAEALLLRQEINDLVLTASLQVDGFLAEIDSETGQVRAVHDRLSDNRDSKLSHSTLWSAVGTGGGAVGSSLALANKTATAGNWVGATFGGVGALFGFLGWFQQRGPKACFPNVGDKRCRVSQSAPSEATDCSPTMLFHLVFPGKPNAGCHSDYDFAIDQYLDSGWREILVKPWLSDAADKAKKEKKEAICNSDPRACLEAEEPHLFARNEKPQKVSIDDLTDRANKLADLRSVVGRMNRDLSRLTETLAAELRCPAE